MTRPKAIILVSAHVVQSREEIQFGGSSMRRDGVTEGRSGFDIHNGRLGDHAAEKGNVETVEGSNLGLLENFRYFSGLDLGHVKVLLDGVVRKSLVLLVGHEKKRVIGERLGQSVSRLFSSCVFESLFLKDCEKIRLHLLRADAELDALFVKSQTNGALPALGAHAQTFHSTDHNGLRSTDVVSIEARNGEGLKDVKFNNRIFFHDDVLT